jgi:hypothetical protein
MNDRILFLKGKSAQEFQSSMGDKAGYVLDYSGVSLFNGYSVVFPSYANMDRIPTKSILSGSDSEKLQQIVRAVSGFIYKADQPDPLLLYELGGNCQAVSLVLLKYFESNKMESGLVLDYGIEHMFNWVMVGEVKYYVDLVNDRISAA